MKFDLNDPRATDKEFMKTGFAGGVDCTAAIRMVCDLGKARRISAIAAACPAKPVFKDQVAKA